MSEAPSPETVAEPSQPPLQPPIEQRVQSKYLNVFDLVVCVSQRENMVTNKILIICYVITLSDQVSHYPGHKLSPAVLLLSFLAMTMMSVSGTVHSSRGSG